MAKKVALLIPIPCLLLALYYEPWLSELETANKAHGLSLPKTAHDIKTWGDWRRGFLDRVAYTDFLLPRSEMEQFVNRLPTDKELVTIVPGYGYFKGGVARNGWKNLEGTMEYSCSSSVGDFLHVSIDTTLKLDVVKVRLYTDWN